MGADNESDYRNQILLSTGAIEQHNSNNDRDGFERDEDSISVSIKTPASRGIGNESGNKDE